MLEQEVLIQSAIVVIVMATGIGTAVESKIFMARTLFKRILMAVVTIIFWQTKSPFDGCGPARVHGDK